LSTVERWKLTNRTLVICTSTNGPVVDDGYKDEAAAKLDGHRPAGPFRGGKYSNFEGGTRVPFIARWPGHVQRGSSNALFSHIDLLASFADLTAQRLAAGEGPDSRSLLATLVGRSKRGRDDLVEQGS